MDGEIAVIRTSSGVMIGDDHHLLIRDEAQEAAPPEPAEAVA